MIILDETMILKISFLGLADEAVISVPVIFDDDLSQEENMLRHKMALDKAGDEMGKHFMKPFVRFFIEKMGITEEDMQGVASHLTENEINRFRELGFDIK